MAMYYKDILDPNGKVVGQTTTYDITAATMYDCGSTLAKVAGGFGTNLSYKGRRYSVTADHNRIQSPGVYISGNRKIVVR